MKQSTWTLAVIVAAVASLAVGRPADPQEPVVRAVLFFSPTCPHCHTVIQRDLPGIFGRFGGPARVYFDESRPAGQAPLYRVTNGQLDVLLVDASQPEGGRLYETWALNYGLPRERWSVPRLVIADTTLVGSMEIPETFPRLIEEGLAAGGIEWPDIAGLGTLIASLPRPEPVAEERMAEAAMDDSTAAAEENGGAERATEMDGAGAVTEETGEADASEAAAVSPTEDDTGAGTEADETEDPPAEAASDPTPTAIEDPDAAEASAAGDPDGEGSETAGESDLGAIPSRTMTVAEKFQRDPVGNSFSVLVLMAMIASVIGVIWLLRTPGEGGHVSYAIPVVSVVGIVVAAYLAYIETSGAVAVCGPVGDCNTVNQSEYATLFGVLPIGVLGLVGYLAIIGAWTVARLGNGEAADWARLSLLAMAAFGTLFSIYLTFLEPFVIGATCAWCLTSAVAITILMWLSARPARKAWSRVRSQ